MRIKGTTLLAVTIIGFTGVDFCNAKEKNKVTNGTHISTHQAFTGYFVNNFLILKSK